MRKQASSSRPLPSDARSKSTVAGVLTGHAHTAAATTFAGRPLIVGPAIQGYTLLRFVRGQVSVQAVPTGLLQEPAAAMATLPCWERGVFSPTRLGSMVRGSTASPGAPWR
ncbi:hypothetical protein EES39_37670 [Streptomyces sp. ADI92-24]|nr:hypothetical protein EES39_37670 [Streptomyces sp. ADI92-24]